MYSVQAIPVTNDQTLPPNTSQETCDRLAQQLAFEWLLPKQETCVYYDIVGRQLVKQKSAPPQSSLPTTTIQKDGLERIKLQLARIDAHLFTFLVCSIAVDPGKDFICCRQCSAKQVPLLFAIHCIALEGTSRFFNGIVDHICVECAKVLCANEMAKSRRSTVVNWSHTLAAIEKLSSNTRRVLTDDFHRLLYLLSNNVGYEIGNMQQFVDLFVQEQFAAEQIEQLHGLSDAQVQQEKKRYFAKPTDVQSFMRCAVCNAVVGEKGKASTLGVLSTVYYNTARVFATPYFVCNTCQRTWQQPSFASQRFSRLLLVHYDAMRHCFKQSLQHFLCVSVRLMGLDYVNFDNNVAGEWSRFCRDMFASSAASSGIDNNSCSSSDGGSAKDIGTIERADTLLYTVENDLLNKLFGLARLEENAKDACAALMQLEDDPCIRQISICIRKCLCDRCIGKNLLFIEMLRRYHYARQLNDQQSLAALDKVVAQFSQLCQNDKHSRFRIKRERGVRTQCQSNNSVESAVSLEMQEVEQQFRRWRLPAKSWPRDAQPKCAQKYVDKLLVNEELEQFFDESSHFLSPMF